MRRRLVIRFVSGMPLFQCLRYLLPQIWQSEIKIEGPSIYWPGQFKIMVCRVKLANRCYWRQHSGWNDPGEGLPVSPAVSHQTETWLLIKINMCRKSFKPPVGPQSSNGTDTGCKWGSRPLLPSVSSCSGRGSGTSWAMDCTSYWRSPGPWGSRRRCKQW